MDDKFDEQKLEVIDASRELDSGHSSFDGTSDSDLSVSDMEAQTLLSEKTPPLPATQGVEYAVPTRVKLFHLGVYFLLNLALTLYNKAILGGFRFPWLMTAIHCATVSIGCYGLLLGRVFSLTRLGSRENMIIVGFSILFTLNIAISNVSLALVSVPTHQTLRATSPFFMVCAYALVFSRTYANSTYLSLMPIMGGVALATYGDYDFTFFGFCMTILGVILATTKSITSNRIMTGSLKLSAYEVLLRMSPLAALQSLGYCWATGEASQISIFIAQGHLTRPLIMAIAGNAIVAFALNVSSFQTNRIAGALTLTVATNLKQCLTIVVGIFLFNVRVGPLNATGMMVTLLGAGIYSKVELDSKGKK